MITVVLGVIVGLGALVGAFYFGMKMGATGKTKHKRVVAQKSLSRKPEPVIPATISEAEIQCTHCDSMNHWRNGIWNGKQAFKCRDCRRSFSYGPPLAVAVQSPTEESPKVLAKPVPAAKPGKIGPLVGSSKVNR